MTPAIVYLKAADINFSIHRYDPSGKAHHYGLEAAEALGLDSEYVYKTLVVALSTSKLGVAVIPVSEKLSMPKMAIACGAKKATMADPVEVERRTGYVLGGVSPVGQKNQFFTIIDESAKDYPTIFVSAGKRGVEIELAPADLMAITQAELRCLTE